ncbi:hypothetical protein ZIOFF_027913 [Zingiber officinale]|uniref:Uncharacterized protein n=1 Tax=Zingiber officinale TaxID=94328 RepID=A0A8J5L9H6_ZINOF|nr:hypothetical protein ZIOFF_027913 [Zingiber officinale]
MADATFEFPSLLFPELVSAPTAASPGLPILSLGTSSPPTPKEIRITRRRPPSETSPAVPLDGSAGLTKPEYRRLRSASSGRPVTKARPTHLHSPSPCVLGPARVPVTMGLSDIRSRQRRPVGEASSRFGWMVLRSLSCNGIESAAVATAPLGLVVRLRGSWLKLNSKLERRRATPRRGGCWPTSQPSGCAEERKGCAGERSCTGPTSTKGRSELERDAANNISLQTHTAAVIGEKRSVTPSQLPLLRGTELLHLVGSAGEASDHIRRYLAGTELRESSVTKIRESNVAELKESGVVELRESGMVKLRESANSSSLRAWKNRGALPPPCSEFPATTSGSPPHSHPGIPKVRSLLPCVFPFASFFPVLALQSPLPPYDFPLRSPLAEVASLIADRGINLRYFPSVQLACKVEIFVRLPELELFFVPLVMFSS